jgi:ketosteroid isomerase-like protein
VDNIAILKPIYAEWAQGIYGGANPYAEDVVLSLSEDFPDIGIEPGLEGLVEAMRYWIRAWERPFIVKAEEFIDLGDDKVMVIGWWRGTSKGSGHVVKRDAAHLWKMRNGKAIKLMLCRDEAEAREFAEDF